MRRSVLTATTMALLTGLAGLVGLSSCSLSRKKADCANTSECRAAFGTGYVCQDDGLCAPADVERRCLYQYPEGLLLSPGEYKNYVVFGSLLRAEGKEGARQDSALLALEAVNDYLDDHPGMYPDLDEIRFGMVQCNHNGSVRQVADLADYLVHTLQTPVIVGPASSSAMQAAFLRVNVDDQGNELRQALFISPSATSVALTELEVRKPGFLWRTAPTDDGQGQLMGKFATERDLSFIAIYEDTPYGRGLYDELVRSTSNACDKCGFPFDASSEKIDALAAVLVSDRALRSLSEADVVFFMGAQENHLEEIISRLDDEEFEGKLLFLSDAGASSDTVGDVRFADTGRVFGTRARASRSGEAWRVFSSIYEARHEETPDLHSFTANSYDAAWLVLLSALRAQLLEQEINPETVAQGMQSVSDEEWTDRSSRDCLGEFEDGDCLPITLEGSHLRDMLEGFVRWGSIDVRGASGDLDYNTRNEELKDSADAFEFWHLERDEGDDDPSIESGLVTPSDAE